jgi:hypothetical protein
MIHRRISKELKCTAMNAAFQYFWPNGSWAGYAKFFHPTISNRDGQRLMAKIVAATWDENLTACNEAINMLNGLTRLEKNGVLCIPHAAFAAHATTLLIRVRQALEMRLTDWGNLLFRYGFEPYDTESSARRVAEKAASEIRGLLEEIQKKNS